MQRYGKLPYTSTRIDRHEFRPAEVFHGLADSKNSAGRIFEALRSLGDTFGNPRPLGPSPKSGPAAQGHFLLQTVKKLRPAEVFYLDLKINEKDKKSESDKLGLDLKINEKDKKSESDKLGQDMRYTGKRIR